MRHEASSPADFGKLYQQWHKMLEQNQLGGLLRATQPYFDPQTNEIIGTFSPSIQIGLHHFRGLAQFRLGHATAALSHFQQALNLMNAHKLHEGHEDTVKELMKLRADAFQWAEWWDEIDQLERSGDYPAAIQRTRSRISQLPKTHETLGVGAHLHQQLAKQHWYRHTEDGRAEGLQAYTVAIEIGRKVSNTTLVVFSLIGRAAMYDRHTQQHEIMQDLREAQDLAYELEDSVRGEVYISIGTILARSEPARAEEILVQALALMRSAGQEDGGVHENLAAILRVQNKYHEAREHFEEAYHRYGEEEDAYRKTLAAAQLADVCLRLGDTTAAKKYILEVVHDLRQFKEPTSQAHVTVLTDFVEPIVQELRQRGLLSNSDLQA